MVQIILLNFILIETEIKWKFKIMKITLVIFSNKFLLLIYLGQFEGLKFNLKSEWEGLFKNLINFNYKWKLSWTNCFNTLFLWMNRNFPVWNPIFFTVLEMHICLIFAARKIAITLVSSYEIERKKLAFPMNRFKSNGEWSLIYKCYSLVYVTFVN